MPRHNWHYGGHLVTPAASLDWAGPSHRSMDAVGAALSDMVDAILSENQPSLVLNCWGLAVWASRTMPNPSAKGSKSTIGAYLILNFLLGPEK